MSLTTMKITIATGIFPPDIGGPATYLREMLPALHDAGIETDIITYGNPRPKITTIKKDATFRLLSFTRATIRSARNSDAILATDTLSSGLPAAIASKITGKPLIIRFVGDQVWENARTNGATTDDFDTFQKRRQSWDIELLRRMQRWALRRAHVLTVSQFLARTLTSWGIHKATVIPNAITQIKLPNRAQLRKKLGYDKKFVCLYAGRITRYKGVDVLILAAKIAQKTIPDLTLVIIGEGPALDSVKALAARENVTHFVTFIPQQEEETVRAHMNAADLVLLNSEYEGMSHMLLEAISVKTPIAASDIGANRELVLKNGMLFARDDVDEIADCMVQTAHDPKTAARKAELAYAKSTTRSRQEKDTITFLQSILNMSSRR